MDALFRVTYDDGLCKLYDGERSLRAGLRAHGGYRRPVQVEMVAADPIDVTAVYALQVAG